MEKNYLVDIAVSARRARVHVLEEDETKAIKIAVQVLSRKYGIKEKNAGYFVYSIKEIA